MNNYIATGFIATEPKIGYTKTNVAYLKMIMGVENFVGGQRKRTQVPIIAFGPYAEKLTKMLKKGTEISLSGYLQTSKYRSYKGDEIYRTQIIINYVELLNNGKNKIDLKERYNSSDEDIYKNIDNLYVERD